jgi:hypothetical protein
VYAPPGLLSRLTSGSPPLPDTPPTSFTSITSTRRFSSYRIVVKLVMPSKKSKSKSSRRWSMYSALHDNVSCLLAEDDLHFDFHENDGTESCIKDYDTNIMGRFLCRNRACGSSGWSSKKIVVTIYMYSGTQYNARVYHQRCMEYNNLSKPRLDDSYAERVAYRLKKVV